MRSIILLLSMLTVMSGQTTQTVSALNARIDSIIAAHSGRYAVAVKGLQSSFFLYRNEHESFHAASTMKTPVMIEVFKQAEQKKFSLNDSIVIRNSFKSIIDGSEYSLDFSDDSDDGIYHEIGKKLTIAQLMFKMITVSSNLATNILIERVGPDNVMRTMRSLGLNDIQVLRGVEDGKAFKAGKNNTTTAYDLCAIFEMIARKSIASSDACNDMIRILTAQEFKDMIPAKLPSDVIVAHKTGSITNVQHDSGIVYLPDGRSYILVILSKELKNNADGIACAADISRTIYDFMVK
ncbi:MAG: serine hydrolase [Bacteroidota bacterium]